jgi:hypothetical protein
VRASKFVTTYLIEQDVAPRLGHILAGKWALSALDRVDETGQIRPSLATPSTGATTSSGPRLAKRAWIRSVAGVVLDCE